MHKWLISLFTLLFLACEPSQKPVSTVVKLTEPISDAIAEYQAEHPDNGKKSISKGTEGKGSLVNGKLFPFSGRNFRYFDTGSYLAGRAFCHDRVVKAMLGTYKQLESKESNRVYRVMECSHEQGGKLFPHRTHQNGLSVDLMIPLKRNGKPYFGLDDKGKAHYFLDFDQQGRWEKDTAIQVDFDLLCSYILAIHSNAAKHGLKVKKVILNTFLHDELFQTKNGFRLKESRIYFAQKLSKEINALHDDHIHVDFEPIAQP
ncbi:MAG: hypothetical protein EP332_01475 [Bacteroidetes bacterium]|nr:MAG: hypothetical protein EP332_01475 [Bacteroidota bacterium]